MQQFLLPLAAQDAIFSNAPAFARRRTTDVDQVELHQDNPVALDQKAVATQQTVMIPGQFPGPANNPGLAAAQSANYLDDMIAAVLKGTAVAQAVKDCHARYVKTFKDFGLPGSKT